MKNTWIVAKRDLGSFFSSPVFYSVTTVFLILYGIVFFILLNSFSFASFQTHQLRGADIGLNFLSSKWR